jgi:hypothetical protein
VDAWQLGFSATAWVEQRFSNKSTRILELGCGAGTVERAKKFDVVAVEHDPDFILEDIRCILAPIVDNPTSTHFNEQGWYDTGKLDFLKDQEFDLIIVDGPPGRIGRSGILSVPWLLNLSPCILIDDTQRESEHALAEAIEARLINVEREELVEESEWGLRKSTVLYRRGTDVGV